MLPCSEPSCDTYLTTCDAFLNMPRVCRFLFLSTHRCEDVGALIVARTGNESDIVFI